MLVECSECGATVDAVLQGRYTFPEIDPGGYETETYIRASLLSCPRRKHPILQFEMADVGELSGLGDDAWSLAARGYPPQEQALDPSVPKPIRVAFDEARRCFKARAFTAAAIMCRKAVQGICHVHNPHGRNLKDDLEHLKKLGVIEGRLFDWADGLRLDGNDAAHDVEVTVSSDDARDMLEFTQALITYTFTLRDRYEAFRLRKQAKAAKLAAKALPLPPSGNSTT